MSDHGANPITPSNNMDEYALPDLLANGEYNVEPQWDGPEFGARMSSSPVYHYELPQENLPLDQAQTGLMSPPPENASGSHDNFPPPEYFDVGHVNIPHEVEAAQYHEETIDWQQNPLAYNMVMGLGMDFTEGVGRGQPQEVPNQQQPVAQGPASASRRSTRTRRSNAGAFVPGPNSEDGPLPDYREMYVDSDHMAAALKKFEDRLMGLNTYWSPPINDNTIPETDEDRRRVVQRLMGAFRDMSRYKDKESNVLRSRWLLGNKPYGDEEVQAMCFTVASLMERLHREGPQVLSIFDIHFMKTVQKTESYTFEARLTVLLTLMAEFKSRCDKLMKGDVLHAFVAAPQDALMSARSNLVQNAQKQVKINKSYEGQERPKPGRKPKPKAQKKDQNGSNVQADDHKDGNDDQTNDQTNRASDQDTNDDRDDHNEVAEAKDSADEPASRDEPASAAVVDVQQGHETAQTPTQSQAVDEPSARQRSVGGPNSRLRVSGTGLPIEIPAGQTPLSTLPAVAYLAAQQQQHPVHQQQYPVQQNPLSRRQAFENHRRNARAAYRTATPTVAASHPGYGIAGGVPHYPPHHHFNGPQNQYPAYGPGLPTANPGNVFSNQPGYGMPALNPAPPVQMPHDRPLAPSNVQGNKRGRSDEDHDGDDAPVDSSAKRVKITPSAPAHGSGRGRGRGGRGG